MPSLLISADWKVKRFTPFFTRESVSTALLSHHNTAAGIFGQLCVTEGTVTYYGFASEQATEPEKEVVIHVGQFATSPPQYWRRAELSDDACFDIHSWVAGEIDDENGLSYTKKM